MKAASLALSVLALAGCAAPKMERGASLVTVSGGMTFNQIYEAGVALQAASLVLVECERAPLSLTSTDGQRTVTVYLQRVNGVVFRANPPSVEPQAACSSSDPKAGLRNGTAPFNAPPWVVGAWVTVTPLDGARPDIRAAALPSSPFTNVNL